MKENDIEQFIRENRDGFDSDLLPNGHEERFKSKLDREFFPTNRNRKMFFVRLAVSALLVISISSVALWSYLNYRYKPAEKLQFSMVTVEYQETRDYYMDQVNIGLNKFKELQFIEKDQIDSISNEFTLMDNNCLQLEKELSENPNDERLMHAIIGIYQVKLEAVNQILHSVSISLNHIKNNRHEPSI